MNKQGFCRGCRKMIRLDNDKIRQHKDKTRSACIGSDSFPLTPEEINCLDKPSAEARLLLTYMHEQMPANLDTALKLAKLMHQEPDLEKCPEFIRLLTGPLSDYILHMSDEDGKIFDTEIQRLKGMNNE